MKRLESHFIIRFFLLCAIFAMVLGGCEELPPYDGEGGILDSPIYAEVYDKYVYVTNANFDLSGDQEGWLALIDIAESLRNRKTCIVNRVYTDPYLGDFVIDKNRGIGYLASREKNKITLVDLSDPGYPEIMDLNKDLDGIQGIPVGIEPLGLALSEDGSLLLVANAGSGDISFVDTNERRLIKNERLSSGINAVTLDPSERYAYVTNNKFNSVSVVEIESGKFQASFAVGDVRADIAQDTRGIAFSEDGQYAFVAAHEPPSLMVVDTEKIPYYPEEAVIEFIPMDTDPTGVKLSPDGTEIWVSNYYSSSIFIVDAEYHIVTDVLDAGLGPYDIEFAPSPIIDEDPGHYFAYVVNFLSHNVFLYDVPSKEVIWAIP